MGKKRSPELEATALALRRTMAVFKGRFGQTLARHDLTFPQWIAMKSLQRGELTVRDLAERCSASPANVVGIVDRLEAAGLVERERSDEDRRVVHVRLTKQGEAKMRDVIDLAEESLAALFEGWSNEELAEFRASLARIKLRPDDAQEF